MSRVNKLVGSRNLNQFSHWKKKHSESIEALETNQLKSVRLSFSFHLALSSLSLFLSRSHFYLIKCQRNIKCQSGKWIQETETEDRRAVSWAWIKSKFQFLQWHWSFPPPIPFPPAPDAAAAPTFVAAVAFVVTKLTTKVIKDQTQVGARAGQLKPLGRGMMRRRAVARGREAGRSQAQLARAHEGN